MNLLPQASGTRPRLACEIFSQGVVAARSESPTSPISAVSRATLPTGSVQPGLKPGNLADRVAVIAALRKVLEDIGVRPGSRGADMTLVIPDAAVRVLLLDFDSLPTRISEALPIVRFRLKKMLPFEADDAMISYQVMSTSRTVVRVLAVAIPRDVLTEYESAAREAGFEPGVVLPSTLAAVAGLNEDGATLLVNATTTGVTTAIVRDGILLLHRGVDVQPPAAGTPANFPPALFGPEHSLPLVNVDDSAAEWAAQQPLPEHGRNPYAAEPAPVEQSPYASPELLADFNAELHNSILVAPTTMREFAETVSHDPALISGAAALSIPAPAPLRSDDTQREVAQSVSVAMAYYEDTLSAIPAQILCAGPLGAEALQNLLAAEGVVEPGGGLRVREAVDTSSLLSEAVTASVPRGWLAGLRGALGS